MPRKLITLAALSMLLAGCTSYTPGSTLEERIVQRYEQNIILDSDSSGRTFVKCIKHGTVDLCSLFFAEFWYARVENTYMCLKREWDVEQQAENAWQEFRKKHGCKVYCSMSGKLAELFRPAYPKIHFIPPGEAPKDCYATYYMGIFFPADDRFHQTTDFRVIGLALNIPYILGLEVVERRPRLTPAKKRLIAEPYVCIAAQSTSQAKYWNNPRGWIEPIDFLKALGYRVLCIDKEKCHGSGRHWHTIPYGCEDFTGDRPLQERVDFLGHADFFVGLGSVLSWLAWGAGVPVVMIVGFTMPGTEFATPYRVQQFHTCHSCANDQRHEHHYDDFGACPHHRGTDREFECTRCITADFVKDTIRRLREQEKTGRSQKQTAH